jgi:tRNA threonylcarbamoyladenosine biosynthesis protein TsaB
LSLILNIDTATSIGSVCLAKNGQPLQTIVNDHQQDHAAMMILYVQEILKTQGITPSQIDAIAVSAGPGSYTGLRVGVATAKGLCYAWEKPLIAISTLQMMTQGVLQSEQPAADFYIPMIDARRMEVYTAVYGPQLNTIVQPQALILTSASYQEQLNTGRTYFFGNGSDKWMPEVANNKNAIFIPYTPSATHLTALSHAAYTQKFFADLAYFSPFYLKAFHSTAKK